MNSERLKQMEMENILAQGDMSNAIDTNGRKIVDATEIFKEAVHEVHNKIIICPGK